VPEKVTIDKSDANTAAIESYYVERDPNILNNTVEQDHGAVKRMTRPKRGFKSFDQLWQPSPWSRAHSQ